jgi:quinoprotein glucose dehydrogenase
MLFTTILGLLVLLFFIDATDYDRNYVNRSKFEISIVHLNSRHSIRISNFLRNNYLYLHEKFFPKTFSERWGIESEINRKKLPETKVTKAITKNYSKPLYKVDDYLTKNDWTRSHGNNFSTRFSKLSKINPENVSQLRLAWTYEAQLDSVSKKENQANPIFYKNRIYMPDVDNKIVALEGNSGKKIWEFSVPNGIAAKRGLILKEDKIYFTDNRKFLYCIDLSGKPVNDFGDKGKIKVGLTPLPPVIFNDQIILITTDSVIKSFNLKDGKINWKYKINKTKNSLIFSNFTKGSPWGGLSLDEKRGLLFFTTGNPEPWLVGVFRPGENLYANSLVAFDLNKKDIKWYFQEIPHDIWNYDLAAPPILTMIKRENKNVDVVVAISKLGNTIILDRETGKPLFDMTYERAPTSNIPGERTSEYQINLKLPEKICRSTFKEDYLTEFDKEFIKEFNNEKKEYNFVFPSPQLLGKRNLTIGSCVRWAGGSIDTKNNTLYVTSDNQVYVNYIVEDKDNMLSYYHESEAFLDNDGFPGIKPPWGAITALNLNTGKIKWQIPFGKIKDLEKKNIYNTGSTNRAGLTATSGNIIFASGTEDKMIRAFKSETGQELWNYKMSSAGSAPPTIYEIDKKQYIVVPAYELDGYKIYSFVLD